MALYGVEWAGAHRQPLSAVSEADRARRFEVTVLNA
jgi:hypothetical protein